MLISDWSSDVCSSDLDGLFSQGQRRPGDRTRRLEGQAEGLFLADPGQAARLTGSCPHGSTQGAAASRCSKKNGKHDPANAQERGAGPGCARPKPGRASRDDTLIIDASKGGFMNRQTAILAAGIALLALAQTHEIGRASCRERVCQYV